MKLKFLDNSLERISIETTNICNLQCRICFLSGMKEKKMFPLNEKVCHFPLKIFKKLINQLRQFEDYDKIRINLSGGEPFLNPWIFEILKLARKYKIQLMIFTNGMSFGKKQLPEILANQPFALMFSIDGPLAEHDANRGKGSFVKILEIIKNLQTAKRNLSLDFPKLAINTVINKLNVRSFDKVVLLAQKLGCDMLSFSLVQWSDSLIIDKSIDEFYQRFGDYSERAKIIEGIDHKLGKLSQEEINEVIKRISLIKRNLSKNSKLVVSFFPDFTSTDEFTKWFSRGCYKINYCSNIFKQIRINCNGDVYPACTIPFFILGNINKESLGKILNGEKAKKLFKEIKTNGFFYVCQRCCRRSPESRIVK